MNIGRSSIMQIKKDWIKLLKILLKNIDPKFKIDWDKFIQKTYILNMPHRKDRRISLESKMKQIKTLKGSILSQITWWRGFYGVTEWDKSIHTSEYSFLYHWNVDPNPTWKDITEKQMRDVIVKCSIPENNIALGHASILFDIVKNKIPVSLILEDDIDFIPGFTVKIEDIFKKQLPSDFDILYISALPAEHGFQWEEFSEDLVKVNNGIWWLSGFIVSNKGAKALIDALPIVGPVDVWINYQFKDLNVYMTKCNLIDQNIGIPSDNTYSFMTSFGYGN
tara:strand:- start:5084 stop:5920 length:837 start_codon:yes stop_codon:yes gene_type:complete